VCAHVCEYVGAWTLAQNKGGRSQKERERGEKRQRARKCGECAC